MSISKLAIVNLSWMTAIVRAHSPVRSGEGWPGLVNWNCNAGKLHAGKLQVSRALQERNGGDPPGHWTTCFRCRNARLGASPAII